MQAVVKTLKAAEAACVKVSFHYMSFLLTHLLKNIKPRKNIRLQRDWSPWPPRYQCDALPTEEASLEAGQERIQFIPDI